MWVKKKSDTSSVVVNLKEHFVMYLRLVKYLQPSPVTTESMPLLHYLMLFDVGGDVKKTVMVW